MIQLESCCGILPRICSIFSPEHHSDNHEFLSSSQHVRHQMTLYDSMKYTLFRVSHSARIAACDWSRAYRRIRTMVRGGKALGAVVGWSRLGPVTHYSPWLFPFSTPPCSSQSSLFSSFSKYTCGHLSNSSQSFPITDHSQIFHACESSVLHV